MRKKFIFLIFLLLFNFSFISVANAASATMKVTSNRSSAIVGNNITITVTVSSATPMANWEFNLNYDSSKLKFVSSNYDFHVVDLDMTQNKKTATYTYTFQAKSSGTATVSLGSSAVMGWDGNEMNLTKASTSISIITQEQLEASYSKNDYLSSLEVEGYELSPKFDKDTLEYTVELEPEPEPINIKGTKDDSRSSVSGLGEIQVTEGTNSIKIVVTAQKGNTRTYTINAIVKELEPINVNVNGKEYSVVQKEDGLVIPSSYFEKTTVLISGKEIPAFYNDIAKLTLVCLKDNGGNTNLYIYENDNYKLYEELKFNTMVIQLLDMDETLLPEGYINTKINIGEKAVVVYAKEGYEYPLLYGLNIETGEKNIYKYDKKENTLQRFEIVNIENHENIYFYIIIGLIGFIILTYLIVIINLIKNNKKREKQLERTMKLEQLEKTLKLDKVKNDDLLGKTMINIEGIEIKKDEPKKKKPKKKTKK